MDWIKGKTKHILYEYEDLTPKEFKGWIQLMALCAFLEHVPSHSQMVKVVHYKTLKSLQDKLNDHSTTLQDIFNKVLTDVQDVNIKKEKARARKRQQRDDSLPKRENVPRDTPQDIPRDVPPIEKRREDIEKNIKKTKAKKSTNFSKPNQNEVSQYFNEYSAQQRLQVDLINEPVRFVDFYQSKGWMVGSTKMKDWKASVRNWLRKKTEVKTNGQQERDHQAIQNAVDNNPYAAARKSR